MACVPEEDLANAVTARCRVPVGNLHRLPDAQSECVSQCLYGESVNVLKRSSDWAQVRTRLDNYVGHVRCQHLSAERPSTASDWTVSARASFLFRKPDLKSEVVMRLPVGARLDIIDTQASDTFASVRPISSAADLKKVGSSLYVWRQHCRPIDRPLAESPIVIARRLFDGTPYLWGGRTPDGADCSGLLQAAASAIGIALPRDSNQQEAALGSVVAYPDRTASDAVFWPGHVALLIDRDTLFHATAFSLDTAIEPLAAVIARAGLPSSIRRLQPTVVAPGAASASF